MKKKKMQKFIFVVLVLVTDIQSHQDLFKTVTYFIPGNVEYYVIVWIYLNTNLLEENCDGKNVSQDAHSTNDHCQNR
jgi:hypothetical protein